MPDVNSYVLYKIADALVDVADVFCDSKWEETIADWERLDAARALIDRLESHGLTITRTEPAASDPAVLVAGRAVAIAVA